MPDHESRLANHCFHSFRLRTAVHPHGIKHSFEDRVATEPPNPWDLASCPPDKSVPGEPGTSSSGGVAIGWLAPEGLHGLRFSLSTNGIVAEEGMIQPAGANIPISGLDFTKRMSSSDIHHTAHFT